MDENRTNRLSSDEIDLIELIAPLIKHLKIIIIAGVVCCVLAAVYVKYFSRTEYSYTSELLLSPSVSDVKDGNLISSEAGYFEKLEYFRKILLSKDLKKQLLVEKEEDSRPGVTFRAEIAEVDRFRRKSLPMLKLTVTAWEQNKARDINIKWVELFKQKLSDLEGSMILQKKAFFEKEFEKTGSKLKVLTQNNEDTLNKYDSLLNKLQLERTETLNAFDLNTEKITSQYKIRRLQKLSDLKLTHEKILKDFDLNRLTEKKSLEAKCKTGELKSRYHSLKAQLVRMNTDLKTNALDINVQKEIMSNLKAQRQKIIQELAAGKGVYYGKMSDKTSIVETLDEGIIACESRLTRLVIENRDMMGLMESLSQEMESLIEEIDRHELTIAEFSNTTDVLRTELADTYNLELLELESLLKEEELSIKNTRELKRETLVVSFKDKKRDLESEKKILISDYDSQFQTQETQFRQLLSQYEKLNVSIEGGQTSFLINYPQGDKEMPGRSRSWKIVPVAGVAGIMFIICIIYGRVFLLHFVKEYQEYSKKHENE